MIIFVFNKDPEIDPEIAEQQFPILRLSGKMQRTFLEDREKERRERLIKTQGNSTDAAICLLQNDDFFYY